MIKYVALLRGINVGGNNIIKMEALRAEFVRLGFTNVTSYIQSGNVLFETEEKDQTILEKKIEKVLSKAFNYTATVLVRSQKDMVKTVKNFPAIFEDESWKHNVIFLGESIDSKKILQVLDLKKDIEQIHYHPGVLYWSAKMDTITKSNMIKLSARKEYKAMTVRNLNTTKKILELMGE